MHAGAGDHRHIRAVQDYFMITILNLNYLITVEYAAWWSISRPRIGHHGKKATELLAWARLISILTCQPPQWQMFEQMPHYESRLCLRRDCGFLNSHDLSTPFLVGTTL